MGVGFPAKREKFLSARQIGGTKAALRNICVRNEEVKRWLVGIRIEPVGVGKGAVASEAIDENERWASVGEVCEQSSSEFWKCRENDSSIEIGGEREEWFV